MTYFIVVFALLVVGIVYACIRVGAMADKRQAEMMERQFKLKRR